jgi:hypothetical protein
MVSVDSVVVDEAEMVMDDFVVLVMEVTVVEAVVTVMEVMDIEVSVVVVEVCVEVVVLDVDVALTLVTDDMLEDVPVVVVHQPQDLSHIPAMSLLQSWQNRTSQISGLHLLLVGSQAKSQNGSPPMLIISQTVSVVPVMVKVLAVEVKVLAEEVVAVVEVSEVVVAEPVDTVVVMLLTVVVTVLVVFCAQIMQEVSHMCAFSQVGQNITRHGSPGCVTIISHVS